MDLAPNSSGVVVGVGGYGRDKGFLIGNSVKSVLSSLISELIEKLLCGITNGVKSLYVLL